MIDSKNPFRPVTGVVVPRNESTEQLPQGKVAACVPIEMFGVYYGDDSGRAHKTVFVRMAGEWYEAPNSEVWAEGLRPLTSKYAKQLDEIMTNQKDKSVPKEDSVDVMG